MYEWDETSTRIQVCVYWDEMNSIPCWAFSRKYPDGTVVHGFMLEAADESNAEEAVRAYYAEHSHGSRRESVKVIEL